MATLRLQTPSSYLICNTIRRAHYLRSRQQNFIYTKIFNLQYSDSVASATTTTPDSSPSSPAFLVHLRNELKVALRAKDVGRLPVLRAILADITNASKTAQPIATDKQLKKRMLRKAKDCRAAALDFQKAGRLDLSIGEQKEAEILEHYAAQIEIPMTNNVTRQLRDP